MTYDPTLTIAGSRFAGRWDGTDAVALADISFVWGRSDIYDPVEPTSFEFSLLDPTGHYATDNDLVGAKVDIWWNRPTDAGMTTRRLFRGSIAEVEAEIVTVLNPATGDNQDVWRVTLSGRDKLADLAALYLTGPGAYSDTIIGFTSLAGHPNDGRQWTREALDAGWWEPTYYTNRANDLDDAIEASGISAGVVLPADANGIYLSPFAALGISDPPSMIGAGPVQHMKFDLSGLELLEELFGWYALGHVNYDPRFDVFRCGFTAESGGLALELVGGKVEITPAAGVSVDAGTVELPEGTKIRSTVTAAIDRVHVVTRLLKTTFYEQISETTVVRSTERKLAGGSANERLLELDPGIYGGYNGSVTTESADLTWSQRVFAPKLAERVRDLVDDLNGKFTPPTIRFDLRRHSYPAELVDVLLLTHDTATPLFMEGSLFTGLPNFPAQVQIIGGTLRWEGHRPGSDLPAGWILDAITAPATGVAPTVTLATLIPNTGPALADFGLGVSIADLGAVTIGLV